LLSCSLPISAIGTIPFILTILLVATWSLRFSILQGFSFYKKMLFALIVILLYGIFTAYCNELVSFLISTLTD
jgi:hypothetical protein